MFKPIIKSDDPNNRVFNHSPKAFVIGVPNQALSFAKSQVDGTTARDFVIDKLISETTKLNEFEKDAFRAKMEGQVLERLKSVEEKAYKEAYALGLQEGNAKGFEDKKSEINLQMEQLASLCQNISQIKTNLLVDNEAHLMKTLFHIAKAMALEEIKANPDNIVKVVSAALESAQSEEEILLRLNPDDLSFIEKAKSESGNPLNRINRLRIETSDSVAAGGCHVETNYGVVDASIEQRLNKIWEALQSKIPKHKDVSGEKV